LRPTPGDAPEALDRWWMRATQEPLVLPARPRLVSTSDSELPGGFSIHAGVRIEGDDREGREQLLRYASRPAFSEVQLSLLEDDVVELELKSPTASGQRVVHLHPVQFLRRLAWLIPPPKQNQVRYYGVFAPTHGLRAEVVPKKVELEVVRDDGDEDDEEAVGDGSEALRRANPGRSRPKGRSPDATTVQQSEARPAVARSGWAARAAELVPLRIRWTYDPTPQANTRAGWDLKLIRRIDVPGLGAPVT
jgi:hypothetical protein